MDVNGTEITTPVLLDNTVLTNLALVGHTDLALQLWPKLVCTTPAVWQEYQAGVMQGRLSSQAWAELPVVSLTGPENSLVESLPSSLGAGERACLAVAVHRKGLFVSDDLDARHLAQELSIPRTGTIGILVLCVRRKFLTRDQANALLAEMVALGYRAPFKSLDLILDK